MLQECCNLDWNRFFSFCTDDFLLFKNHYINRWSNQENIFLEKVFLNKNIKHLSEVKNVSKNSSLRKERNGFYDPKRSCVLVDGKWNEQVIFDSEDIEILSLKEAIDVYKTFFMMSFERWKNDNSFFSLLNAIAITDGVFLYFPEDDSKSETELDLILISSIENSPDNILLNPRIHIFVDKGRRIKLKIIEKSSNKIINNIVIDAFLEEEGNLKIISESSCSGDLSHTSILTLRTYLKSFSTGSYSCLYPKNSNFFSCDVHSILAKEGSSSSFVSGGYVEGENKVFLDVKMEHRSYSSRSRQKIKFVNNDASHCNIKGHIYIDKKADKSDAYQKIDSMLLSSKARVHSEPKLEIFASDVKASHGATLGGISNLNLCYLMSKGLSEIRAKNLIIDAFMKDLYNEHTSLLGVRE